MLSDDKKRLAADGRGTSYQSRDAKASADSPRGLEFQPRMADRREELRNREVDSVTEDLTPGMFVRHPLKPEWGIGQVQSAVGHRVTVNFEHAGKVLINCAKVTLTPVAESEL